MTKKDYKLIADAIKDARYACAPGESEAVTKVAESIADALSRDNPRFDRDRFLNATHVG